MAYRPENAVANLNPTDAFAAPAGTAGKLHDAVSPGRIVA